MQRLHSRVVVIGASVIGLGCAGVPSMRPDPVSEKSAVPATEALDIAKSAPMVPVDHTLETKADPVLGGGYRVSTTEAY